MNLPDLIERLLGFRCVDTGEVIKSAASINAMVVETAEALKQLAAALVAKHEAIEGAIDYVEEAEQRFIAEYGENYKPHRLQYIRDVKNECFNALAIQPHADLVAKMKADAFVAGFMASSEGWNGEYPFGDLDINPLDDKLFMKALSAYADRIKRGEVK